MRNGDLAVYLVTIVGVVFLNLLQGVLIGLAVAVIATGWRVVRSRVQAEPVGDEWRVIIEGACTFLSLPRLTAALAAIPERTTVTIHLMTNYLDHAAHQAMSDWQRRHCATGGAVRVHDGPAETHAHVGGWSKGGRRAVHLSLVEAETG